LDPTGLWLRADQLFDQALDLPPGERPAFLDRACGGDAELRALVDRLLAGAEAEASRLTPGGGLQNLLQGLRNEEEEGSLVGATVGRYRIVRELGRGGMAVVYLAERADGQFEQQVALKLLKRGLDTDDLVARFDQERQILAMARHPGIARLLDGGVGPGGRPYLAMEHVEGRPIDLYCDDERLTVPERLRLFLQVARAVEDAHRNLVVHRDIKPSNILVTVDGHAKLLDFGIAKLLDPGLESTPVTRTAARLLTPAYASPEQLQGEPVTTASDVYQLGVLLYLLLAGRFPYDMGEKGPVEAARIVATQEPVRPSAAVTGPATGAAIPGREEQGPEEIARARLTTSTRLARELAGDLDTIVLTALRKEPERRYAAVAKLIDDVERYLEGRPISARPDTVRYRAGKFARRNAAALSTAAAALVLVIALTVLYTVQLARERDRAELAAARAAQVSTFLQGLFEVSAPTRSLGEQITARQLLDQGARRIDELGDPGTQADLMLVMGDVYRELALYEEAQALLERAVSIRRKFPGESGLSLAESLHHLARLTYERADHTRSRSLYEQVLALREKALGPHHPEVGKALVGLGRVLLAQGDSAGARRSQEKAVVILESALGPRDPEVGFALRSLAGTLGESFEEPAAQKALVRALEILEARYGAGHPHVANTRVMLGNSLADQGNREAAWREYDLALPVLHRVYGEEHPAVAALLQTMGDILIAAGSERKEPGSAIPYYERALAIRKKVFGTWHPLVADTLEGLGRARRLLKQWDLAIPSLLQSLEIRRKTLGPEHVELSTTLMHLAGVYDEAGQPGKALALYDEALQLREKAYGSNHTVISLPLYYSAKIRRRMGDPAAGEALVRRVLEIYRLNKTTHGVAMAQVELGRCLIDQGRHGEAEELLLPIASAKEEPTRSWANEALVALYERWKKPEEAARHRAALVVR
jgi:serine/threonine protein kinase